MHPLDPSEWISLAGWNCVPDGQTSDPVHDVAAACGVSPATVRGWRRTGKVPEPAARLLRVLALGMPGPAAGPAWDGWRFANGHLVCPDGLAYTPGDVRAGTHYRQAFYDTAAALERERRPQLELGL